MRRGNPELRKRQFINVVENTIYDCLKIFGYSKAPYIFETQFDTTATIMIFAQGNRGVESAIYYDYQKFQRVFRDCDDQNRVYRLIHIVAHEMRHYYQFRQVTAKKPRENGSIVREWKADRVIRNNSERNAYFGNVRELDANAFAYMYMADRFGVLLNGFGIPDNYRVRMNNYVKKLYGTSHPVFGPKYAKCFS